jgi:septal ring factor EnvC (AmiA/AmiB activator)
MTTEQIPRSNPAASQAQHQVTPAEIEHLIEQIGSRYIADLRTLSEEFARFYNAQLTAKDGQIADLSRRLEAAERERDALEAQIHRLKRTSASYIANLRAMSEELSRRLEYTEGEQDTFKAPNQGGAP